MPVLSIDSSLLLLVVVNGVEMKGLAVVLKTSHVLFHGVHYYTTVQVRF